MNATLPAAADLAAQINAEHQAAFGKAREALAHARRAGELLLEAKAAVGHGEWLPWLKASCKFSERTAQGYMRLARNWDALQAKSATVADLGLAGALRLLAPTVLSDVEEMRSWGDGFAQLADSYTGSRDDAEQYTKLVAEWISTGCLRVAERYGVPYEFVSGTFMAMLGMRLEAAA